MSQASPRPRRPCTAHRLETYVQRQPLPPSSRQLRPETRKSVPWNDRILDCESIANCRNKFIDRCVPGGAPRTPAWVGNGRFQRRGCMFSRAVRDVRPRPPVRQPVAKGLWLPPCEADCHRLSLRHRPIPPSGRSQKHAGHCLESPPMRAKPDSLSPTSWWQNRRWAGPSGGLGHCGHRLRGVRPGFHYARLRRP
jgi:hypothetical protein